MSLFNLFSTKKEEENLQSYVETLLLAKKRQLFVKRHAIEHAIDMIAKTIAKSEIQVYRKSQDGKIKKSENNQEYYKLNIQPNPNEEATSFFYKVIKKYLDDQEALIVCLDNSLYLADSFLSTNSILLPKIYYNVQISDSNNIKAGDTVFALGSPLDSAYSFTVTRGIISGKERLVEITSNNSNILLKVIQTDAAVNSGNSGGPLCNANGQVIGVVNAKLSGSGIEGIGFAIPIDTAIEKADEIIGGNEKEYPYIGVSIASVSDAKNDFRYYSYVKSLDIEEGILVLDVEKNSPAYNKLKKGDVITKINDSETKSTAYFRYELYKYNINDEITITYIRDGKVESTKIKLSKKNSNI